MKKGFWFRFLKNFVLGTTALVVLILVLNNFFQVPVFKFLKPQVTKAAYFPEVPEAIACCRAGIQDNACAPGTGNEWKFFGTQAGCDDWANQLRAYGYTCNPGEGVAGYDDNNDPIPLPGCRRDGSTIRCEGGISQSTVNNGTFCGVTPPPAPTPPSPAPSACLGDESISFDPSNPTVGQQVTVWVTTAQPTSANMTMQINGPSGSFGANFLGATQTGGVTTWRWWFTPTQQSLYTIRLSSGSTFCKSASVNVGQAVQANPTCSIQASPDSGSAPLFVSFMGTANAAGGANVSETSWDFGFGPTMIQSHNSPSVTVTTSNTFQQSANVRMTVRDSSGRPGECNRQINVTALSQLSCDLRAQVFGSQVTLTNTPFSSSGVSQYFFDFGDGLGELSSFSNGPMRNFGNRQGFFTARSRFINGQGQPSSKCTTTFNVPAGQTSCSVQARFRTGTFGDQWSENKTVSLLQPVQAGGFRNFDFSDFNIPGDLRLRVMGPGTDTPINNRGFFNPTCSGQQSCDFTLQVTSTIDACSAQAFLHVVGGGVGGGQAALSINKKVIFGGVERESVDASTHRFTPGETINYRLVIQNFGGNTADNVTVSDIIPTFLTPLNSGGGFFDGSRLTFNIGSLGAGSARTLDYTVTVKGGLPAGDTTQTNFATVTSNNANSASDSSSVIVRGDVIQGVPALQITKSPANQTVSLGGIASFSIQVVNVSSVTVRNISIIDNLPSGFSFVGGSTTGATNNNPSISGNQLTWSDFNLSSGSTLTINFRATAPNSSGSFTNTARALFEGGSAGPVTAGVFIQQEVILQTIQPIQQQIINPIVLTRVVPVTTGQVLGATTLPKTGSEALLLGGLPFLGGLGYKLREYRSRKKGDNFADIFTRRQKDKNGGSSILG